jgi:hypothetical protein
MKGIIQCAKQNGCVTSVLVPILCIMSALFLLVACGKANSEDRVRQATHADDLWYPSTASKLTEVVDGYLANVKEPMTGNVTALISPHAESS